MRVWFCFRCGWFCFVFETRSHTHTQIRLVWSVLCSLVSMEVTAMLPFGPSSAQTTGVSLQPPPAEVKLFDAEDTVLIGLVIFFFLQKLFFLFCLLQHYPKNGPHFHRRNYRYYNRLAVSVAAVQRCPQTSKRSLDPSCNLPWGILLLVNAVTTCFG